MLVCFKEVSQCALVNDDATAGDLGPIELAFETGCDLSFVYSDECDRFSMVHNTINVLPETTKRPGMITSTHSWMPLIDMLLQLDWPAKNLAKEEKDPLPSDIIAGADELPGFLESCIPEYAEWCLKDAIEHEDSSSDETASSSHSFDKSSSSKVAAKPFHEEADVIQVMLAMAIFAMVKD